MSMSIGAKSYKTFRENHYRDGEYTSAEAAKQIGIHKRTLFAWITRGWIPDTQRDSHGRRIWTQADIDRAKAIYNSDGPYKPEQKP